MQSRNGKGAKGWIIAFAGILYAVGVIYGDVLFFSIVSKAFPNGFLGTLALVGAFVAGGTALALPIALHWWHAEGPQQVGGYIFYTVDLAVIALNAMLAYQLSVHGSVTDTFWGAWLAVCPATPIICVAGWAILFSLDSSHKMRHAIQNLQSDQIDIYAQGLRDAAQSPEVRNVIHQGALIHAQQEVAKMLGLNVTFHNQPQLPSGPVVDSTPTQSPTQQPIQQKGFFGRIGDAITGKQVAQSPALSASQQSNDVPDIDAILVMLEQRRQQREQSSIPVQNVPSNGTKEPQTSPLAEMALGQMEDLKLPKSQDQNQQNGKK